MSRKRPTYRLPLPKQATTANRTVPKVDVETLVKSAGAIGLILYAIGLFSINGYLFGLGVSDFGLIRPRFIYTGALIAAVTLACIIPPSYGVTYVRQRMSRGLSLINFDNCTMIVVAFILVPLLLWQAFYFGRRAPSMLPPTRELMIADARDAIQIWLLANALGLIYLYTGRRFMRWSSRFSGLFRYSAVSYLVFASLLATMIYLLIFMSLVYPKVPVQFGGGQAIPVHFLIKHEAVEGVKSLGLTFSAGEDLSNMAFLTYQDEKSYVITLANSSVVQIDRTAVSAVIVQLGVSEAALRSATT